jgi:integrase
MKLTKAAVQALKLPASKTEAIFFDDEIAGFGLRLRAGGSRSWVVQYKLGNKHRRITFGSVAVLDPNKARERARDLLAEVRLGRDPAGAKIEARARADETLGAIVERFLARQKSRLRPRSYLETERYLQAHWKPLHGLVLAKVSRATVASRLTSISDERGLTAADRARAALSGFFSWAMREGIAEINPVLATNRSSSGKSRDRVLSDIEIAAIWKALPKDQYGTIVRLLILTGQRREEIGGLRWSEFKADKALITLPGERTKNHRQHDVPLSLTAVMAIEAQPRRRERDLIFGEGEGPFQGWSRAKATLDKRIAKLAHENGNTGPWRMHDIRRTVATRMADLGVQPHIVEAVLNHVSGHKAGVAGVYNRSVYGAEKRTALEVWTNHVLKILNEPGQVLRFPDLASTSLAS